MFIGNLPGDASPEAVGKLFSEFGTVRSVQLATDVFTRQCRGFGFVEMPDDDARTAIEALDGSDFGGRPLGVNEARPRR